MSDPFDVIPFEDLKGDWQKLGSGSFGNVYKGCYLGIEVAIKEVLSSDKYDVAKYFEREWRLMKEARHPNVVLYLGLSRAPSPDNRIFIISEYIENGNLRTYIHNKEKPFPWRLRLSFAIDIARALAYLHARKCIHRDLKGENLLVTDNGRLKITDFGFARIAARNEDEVKRLTFCGTDSYMSPEIQLGDEFDLPTDIFSFGIILCEISARTLADDHNFKRTAPTFCIDTDEVRRLASPDCPQAFLDLCLDCLALDPKARPTTRVILERLREIEAEILLRPSDTDVPHIGSVKFMRGRRPGPALRIPSFGLGVGKDIRNADNSVEEKSSEDSDEEAIEAMKGMDLSDLTSAWDSLTTSTASESQGQSKQPLLNDAPGSSTPYSTTVIRSPSPQSKSTILPSLSSVLTVRPAADPSQTPDPVPPVSSDSIVSLDTYHTAHSVAPSSAAATLGGSTIRSMPLVHRFTLIKPGARRQGDNLQLRRSNTNVEASPGWNPLDLFLSSGLLVAKCDICSKRLGWKPVLECDDCGLRTHVKCGEAAPCDCGVRPAKPGIHQLLASASPLSKVKQNAKAAMPLR